MPVHKIGPEFVSSTGRLSAASIAKRQGLTGNLWRDFNFESALENQGYGSYVFDRGQYGANYTATAATSGSAAYAASATAGFGTVLKLDSGATTNTQGEQVQWTSQGVYPAAGQVIYAEWMLRWAGAATGPEGAIGLATIDTAVIASNALSTTDFIGFYSASGGTFKAAAYHTSLSQSTSAIYTLTDGTTTTDGTEWARVGFRWNVGASTAEFYVNGVKQDSSGLDLATYQPTANVCMTLVCQSNGTTQPTLERAYHAFGVKYPA